MHPTADTKVVKFLQWLGAQPELRRCVAQLPLGISSEGEINHGKNDNMLVQW
jgi:hypothetical protein